MTKTTGMRTRRPGVLATCGVADSGRPACDRATAGDLVAALSAIHSVRASPRSRPARATVRARRGGRSGISRRPRVGGTDPGPATGAAGGVGQDCFELRVDGAELVPGPRLVHVVQLVRDAEQELLSLSRHGVLVRALVSTIGSECRRSRSGWWGGRWR